MTERTTWVNGFLFRNDGEEVALISKTHPEWQAGKLNGIGGKIEVGETVTAAMQREFLEEAGVEVKDWRKYAVMQFSNGDMHCLVAHGDYAIASMTEESVDWYPVREINTLPIIPNLAWLIPLALDAKEKSATIEYL